MIRVLPQEWACGAAGSALPWHGRGHRFDPDQVHQITQALTSTSLPRPCRILVANCKIFPEEPLGCVRSAPRMGLVAVPVIVTVTGELSSLSAGCDPGCR